MKVTVVGLGLMGGSFGLALKMHKLASRIYGVDSNNEHQQMALDLGIVDECVSFEEGISTGEVIILATPVNVLTRILSATLSQVRKDQIVIDLGSTKGMINNSVHLHPNRDRYVSAHPMAGTENTGPRAAFPELYRGAVNVVCNREESDQTALKRALDIFNMLGMNNVFMDAEDHDKHVAYISHLSHISSFTLGLTVLDKEKDEKNIANLAGSGFESTVRLAKSSPDMWAPIFSQNKTQVSQALSEYITQLIEFKEMIDSENQTALLEAMKRANDIRRILKK